MTQTETWTIGRLLTWTTDFFKKRGIESPRLEAEVLLAFARKCQRIELYTSYDAEPTEEIRTAFKSLVKRRAEGTPVAYLVGHREFFSLDFEVNESVLIPRPETEFLVMALLDLAKEVPETAGPIQAADLGTGSGIIAITTARQNARFEFVAVDKSAAALEVAKRNAAKHGIAARIEFIESDWFAAVPAERRFDFVASNPPYITTAEMATLAKDVRDFEPNSALEAGPLGTEAIAALVPQAAERLKTGGRLLIEFSPQIEAAVQDVIRAESRLEFEKIIRDLAGRPRVVQAVKK